MFEITLPYEHKSKHEMYSLIKSPIRQWCILNDLNIT